MKKNKRISIVGVVLSSIALIASIIELVFCVINTPQLILMPVLLILLMFAVLVANLINLIRIVNYNKKHQKKDKPNESLVTIEVRNNRIVQAKRRFNEDVTSEDQKAIDFFNKKFANKEDKAA